MKAPQKPAILKGLSQEDIFKTIGKIYRMPSNTKKEQNEKNKAIRIRTAWNSYENKLHDYHNYQWLRGDSMAKKYTLGKNKTMTKSTTIKTAATSKSTKSTKATKLKTDKKYSYAEVRALLKRALRSRRTIKKRGLGKSHNTRYAGRIEKGVYTYKLRNR